MKKRDVWVLGIIMFFLVALVSVGVVSAELTEAEKQAIELALEAEKQALEDAKVEEQPVEDVELTEEEKQALEAAKKAAEDPGDTQAVTFQISGIISDITPDETLNPLQPTGTITVGIIGDTTFNVTIATQITFNGESQYFGYLATPSPPYITNDNFPQVVGDKAVIKYDPVTRNALSLDVEGSTALYASVYYGINAEVTFLGDVDPGLGYDFGMYVGGAGAKLDAAITQVTINGIEGTIADIQVGDIVEYMQSSTDLTAYWVKITY